MSSNKKQKLNSSVHKKRQSFDERIDDDLSEVILQFLPFNDKFRLESVSKQFQRTIFNKVYKVFEFVFNFGDIPVKIVLKKCPNIQHLILNMNYFKGEEKVIEYNLIIDLIIKYCDKLTQIKCYFNKMNDTNREKFIEKFGPKLKYFTFHDTCDGNVVKYFPNIKELYLFMSHWSLIDCEIPFKRLKTLKVYFNDEQDSNINKFSTFITYNPLIENLYLYALSEDIIAQISRLENLAKLVIRYPDVHQIPEFGNSLTKIAVNCPKLKTLHYNSLDIFESYIELNQCFSLLKTFKNINRLYLLFDLLPTFKVKDLSFKLFKGFEEITHLYLDSRSEIHVKDTILADLDINLPKLQYLNIENLFFITTDLIPNIVSGLTSLHTIKLNIKDNNMKQILKTKLREQKKLKIIEL